MAFEMAAQIRADLASIEAGAARLAQPVLPAASLGESDGQAATVHSFADSMWQAVRAVDAQGQAASERMEAVDSGRSDDLVGAMLASQEASLSFSMLMQVRNKVVGAVDELIKLQL